MAPSGESTPLLLSTPERENKRVEGLRRAVAAGTLLFAATGLAALSTRTTRSGLVGLDTTGLSSESLTFSNAYGGQPSSVALGYYPFDTIVEPFRTTTIGLPASSSCASWHVTIMKRDEKTLASWVVDGTNFTTHEFTSAGELHRVKADCVDGVHDDAVATDVVCKYVRRELRALHAEDANRFLDAMEIVYKTRHHDGRALYGDQFTGIEWFTRWHLGSPTKSSPYHGAPSFFTAHAAFGDIWSRSLQSIDPSVAAHYWDFTIDSNMVARGEWQTWSESFMWSKNWFGPFTLSAAQDYADSDKRVHGRFEAVELGRNTSGSNTHNSYGLVTEPFNNNPSVYLTRAFEVCGLPTITMEMPGCEAVMGAINKRNAPNMVDFHENVEFNTHLAFHGLLGGATDCGENWANHVDLAKLISPQIMSLESWWMNNWYHDNLHRPSSCSLNTSFEDCRISCQDLDDLEAKADASDSDWYQLFEKVYINGSKLPSHHQMDTNTFFDESSGQYKIIGAADEDQIKLYHMVVKTICRPGKISQMMSPLGSMDDPVFFPLHVYWERMWAYRRLVQNFDSYWHLKAGIEGWQWDDPLQPFNDAYGTVREPAGSFYTNAELVHLFDPTLVDLPHIYDDLSFTPCQAYSSR